MIEATELTKHYGAKTAVDGLTFTVTPGRVTGFLGPNGAGKSTTMRLMLQLDRPTSGHVRINGKEYGELTEPLRQVGALLESRAAHPGRSAYNHLLSLAASNRIPRQRVRQVIEMVGLESVAGKRVRGFSLGMTQRLGLAAALLGDPPVLLLDEPINGLDPEGVRWIRQLLTGLAAEGRTVLLSSHLMTEMAATADHLIIIGRGRMLADISTSEFVAQHAGSYIRVRSPEAASLRSALTTRGIEVTEAGEGTLHAMGAELEQVGAVGRDEGLIITELTPCTASLEDAFIKLTADAVEYRGGITEASR
ncbi:ATP-binding cassette domain-containing protein [Micromonospora ureilytica]|uniref:ABC transporter ATP-binding protein n=1 Tax=Micromonospora ureilytica TaxID=709868 RepID=UPI002E161096|nr:ATP-binding cassette domain-containing protein [Micromonospora ureilytica]